MTESCTVVCSTPHDDIDFGSSGCLLPGFEARIIDEEGQDITEHDRAGELLVKSPSVTLGYLDNPEATKEAFIDGGWLKSGDKALIHKSPQGNEHIWIVDRMKELIKVKVSLPQRLGNLRGSITNLPSGATRCSRRAGSPSADPSLRCRHCRHIYPG